MSLPFCPPPRGAARSRRPQTANPPAEVQRKTSCPERANTLTQFAYPAQPVQKRSRPLGANPPAAVRAPRWVGAEKEPPRQGEHANAVRVPRSAGAENPGNPEKIFPPEKGSKNAHSHAEKTSIQTVQLAKPNHPEFSRIFLSKKCLTYWLGYANLYTWLAEAY